MVTINPRSSWGAAKQRPSTVDPRLVVGHAARTHIVIHHGASGEGANPDAVPGILRAYQQTHFRNGYNDIGYHWAVDAWGRVWALRPATERGAHSYPNTSAYGIVYVGDGRYSFTGSALAAMRDLIRYVDALRGAQLPIVPHSSRQATTCPGDLIRAAIPSLRAPSVRAGSLITLEQAGQLAGWLGRGYHTPEYVLDLQQHAVWRGYLSAGDRDGVYGPQTAGVERRIWEDEFAPKPAPEPSPPDPVDPDPVVPSPVEPEPVVPSPVEPEPVEPTEPVDPVEPPDDDTPPEKPVEKPPLNFGKGRILTGTGVSVIVVLVAILLSQCGGPAL